MSRTMIAIVGPVPDLDRSAPVPLWIQLRDRLADDITAGRLTGQIPSAAALAAAYSVSKPTAEKALRALGEAGLTVGVPGKGTFVRRREE